MALGRRAAFLSAVLGVLSLFSSAPVAQTPQVGVSTAVNPAASGTPPDAPRRDLYIGNEIVHDERIQTEDNGQAQIVFVDQSAFTVGPGSDLVIDDFIYDPATTQGKLVASAGKGVLRFIGGAISKSPESVVVNTPASIIAIRGGVMLVAVDGGATTAVLLHGNEMTVSTRTGETRRVVREEFGITVDAAGRAGTIRAMPQEIVSLSARLDPHTAQRQQVDPARIAAVRDAAGTGIKARFEAVRPEVYRRAGLEKTVLKSDGVTSPFAFSGVIRRIGTSIPVGGDTLAYRDGRLTAGQFVATLPNGQLSIPIRAAPDGSFASADVETPFGPATGSGFISPDLGFVFADLRPSTGAGEGLLLVFGGGSAQAALPTSPAPGTRIAYNTMAVGGAGLPFLTGQGGASIPGVASPLLLAFGDTPGQAVMLQAGLGLQGTGGTQTSALVVAVGGTLDSGGKTALGGFVRGTARLDASAGPTLTRASLGTVRDADGNSFFGGGGSPYFVLDQNGYDPAGNPVASLATVQASSTRTPASQYGFAVAALPQGAPPAAASRTAQTMTGFAAGIAETAGGPGRILATRDSDDFTLTTDPSTNRIAVQFAAGDSFGHRSYGHHGEQRLGFDLGDSSWHRSHRHHGEQRLVFGGLDAPGRSAFIDDTSFGAVEAASPPANSWAGGNSSAVAAGGAFISAGAVSGALAAAFPDVTFCNCQYARWGFWSAALDHGWGQVHLGTWIAGSETPLADLPRTGIAAFAGHAIGSVDNAGRSYVAAGAFQGRFDFGARTGTVAIANFDGRSVGGSTASANGRNYQGGLSGSGLAGTVTGTMFGPKAAETGGAFTLTQAGGAAGYRATGTFAARR